MNLKEISQMLEECSELGVLSYTATGGEPLLREDLPEILKRASDLGLYTILFTNGLLLKGKRFQADRVFVSLDTLSEEKFQKITGVNALHRVLEALRWASEEYELCINTVLHGENVDEIEDLVRFADEIGADISFEPVSSYFDGCPEMDSQSLREAARKILELKRSYRCILNSKSYLAMIAEGRRFECKPHLLLRVNPDGSIISPCYEVEHIVAGEVREGLRNVIAKDSYLEGLKRAENCKKCYLSCYAEPSLALSLRGFLYSIPTLLRFL